MEEGGGCNYKEAKLWLRKAWIGLVYDVQLSEHSSLITLKGFTEVVCMAE